VRQCARAIGLPLAAVFVALAVCRCSREAPRATAAQAFAIDSQPLVSIAGSAPDGAPLLGLIGRSTRLADGTIVVADYTSSTLKFFDGQGRLIRTIGRAGGGPGEFQMLNAVRRCDGDSLFATDAAHGVSVFNSGGAFVRQFRLPQFARLTACSPGGVLAVVNEGEEEQPDIGKEVRRVRAPLVLADPRGEVIRELGMVSLYDIHSAGSGWLPQPGSAQAAFAVGRERMLVCPNDSDAVGVYGIRGKGRRPIPLAVPPRAPTRAYVEKVADRFLAATPVGAFRDRLRERFLALPPAEHLPPCSNILVDPDDNVWVVLSALGDSVTSLRIFGPDDRLLGDLTVPAALDVHEIGADYLLGSGETAEGEPWVRVYRVSRTVAR